jgi:hypothetical protein
MSLIVIFALLLIFCFVLLLFFLKPLLQKWPFRSGWQVCKQIARA